MCLQRADSWKNLTSVKCRLVFLERLLFTTANINDYAGSDIVGPFLCPQLFPKPATETFLASSMLLLGMFS